MYYKSNTQDIGDQYIYLQPELTMWPIKKLVKYVMTLLAVIANVVYVIFELISSSKHLAGESPASTTEAALSILGAVLALMTAGAMGRELRQGGVTERKECGEIAQNKNVTIQRAVSLNFLP